ncbi:neuraminidase-like domain-containing protein [Xenorhabdus bovienii]|uniref:Tc toxin subunit A-related protein n=1 Tax=Xenorhabdus bovienii TaxID=40576 RepID=UPI0023B229E9|nr:neuraminidase-like domain-containing protein [Xenorhabdus bovienii]MDE9463153.1 hypothetical protein [Xenorhabdus bovienii]MDE9470938.1 hypothetical protein [Xenorhabdus bovienii]
MSTKLFTQTLKEARRDALVNHYIASHDFGAYAEKINTADDLYEYLLLDTKISDQVKTSHLSEAVGSLQLYIHRAMEGYDGELINNDEVKKWFTQDAFLYNWDRYNKRYSTWAGKEKLRFYAGNYVEPSLRRGKTELFKTLEASLEMGKLTEEQIYDSVIKYVWDYQELADLSYISSCSGDNGDIYYIGRHEGHPVRYCWRKAKLDKNESPKDWTEWHAIDIKGDVAIDGVIFPSFRKNRLYIYWYSEGLTQGSDGETETVVYYNEQVIEKNETWRVTKKELLESKFIPTLAATSENDNIGIASIPISLWKENELECIDQAYDEVSGKMRFLCRDADKNIYLNTFSIYGKIKLSPFKNGHPYYISKRLDGLIGTSFAQKYSLAMDEFGWAYIDYLIKDEGLLEKTFRYNVKYDEKTYLSKESGKNNIEYTAKSIKSLTPVKSLFRPEHITYSPDRKHASAKGGTNGGYVNFEVEIDPDGKSYTVTCNYNSEPILVVSTSNRIEPGESKSLKIHGSGDIRIALTTTLTFCFLSLDIQETSNEVDVWDIVPTKYGVVDNSERTFVPPKKSSCPALGFGSIKHNYPKFDLTTYLADKDSTNIFDYLYRYALQGPLQIGGMAAFNGHNGMYLWEIFFHIPFLAATRFATEQRFDEAERWYKYIFNSAGYRDEDGAVLTGLDGNPRYWNCYPLQKDSAWDALADMPTSTDPDVIAAADPMHYKLAIFLHTLDFLIVRGDAAYRLLERDTMTEAKMYYVQAQQLLGPRPDIPVTNTWPNPNPTLASEAGSIGTPLSNEGPMTFGQWLSDGDYNEMGDGHFLPPYNDVLLAYWDKLELRLYNLRHNLSLDGQPLNLPLFATPVDPKELHRQQSGGDGIQGDTAAGRQGGIGWRYTLLAEHARTAVSQLMQFGASLQNSLECQDSEKLTLLMQTQQVSVLKQQQNIAQKNLESLNASLTALHTGRASAELRKAHYTNLINGDLSAAEIAGLALRSASMVSNGIAAVTVIGAGIASALPNTFGLANGGGDFGAPVHALFQSAQATAVTLDQSAGISEVTGGYQRRTEEWALQRDIAEKEVEQMDAQIDSLRQQMTMAQKQIVLNEMEAANAQALYDLQSSRFTGQALYNWMVGRLSALYYQLYDATIPVCLQAKAALEQELGRGRTDGLFQTPVWNDLWQGLLAGEGLNVELQKLGNVWLEHSAKGLEATRTVSLARQRGEVNGNLNSVIDHVLTGKADTPSHGVTLALNGDGMFSAELDLAELGLNASYNMKNKARYIKSVAVTLPTLLEPYQDIEATLQLGNEVATLSHGMNDNGRFVTNFDDSRFLPFEGADPTSGKLTLNIFHVQDNGAQRATVENLSDVVFHLHYILRDKA